MHKIRLLKIWKKYISGFFLVVLFHGISSQQVLAEFVFYSAHPYAAQVGSLDDQIEDLMLNNGVIYAGYGSHNNHNYETKICGFTPPNTNFSCPFSIDSEGAGHFRNLDGKLYIAGIDPRTPNFDFYVRNNNGSWFAQTSFTGNVAHIYDLESSNGNIWLTLTKYDDDARVMKGTDGGVWVEVLDVEPETGHTSNNYSVLYFIAEYQGELYTQAFDTLDGIRAYSFVSTDNGTTWNHGSNILLHVPLHPNAPGGVLNYRHEVFAGKLVMKQTSYLTSFDGLNAVTLRSGIRNFTTRDGFLYVLEESGRILRTEDLMRWEYVDTAPENSSSLEVLNNDIYVGTEDANIHWSENILDELPRVNLVPTYYLLMFDN